MRAHLLLTVCVTAIAFWPVAATGDTADGGASSIVRATLDNGLRVVIIRNTLAPVVTVEENYLAGGNETPPGYPGMAHAQEHMAFRGCKGLAGDQIAAIYAQLGGFGNADTQQNITQYFTTVPAQDLDVALRVDAACMADAEDSQQEWAQERGAIEQEVARDLSNPTYKFITRINEDMFAGTPYSHDALGTKESFDTTTGAMLKQFYKTWYAPNNAILVLAGNIDPGATLAKIKQIYGAIPKHDVPARPAVSLRPVKSESFVLDSNLPYTLCLIGYRLPGSDDADYATSRVLSDVLSSQRGKLYELVPEGKALAAQFGLAETFPKASVAFSLAALPAASDGAPIIAEMKKIIAGYVKAGLPAELVDAAKKAEIASAEFERNSIPGLAASWSQALAAEGRNSPDEDVAAIRRVTVDDVNRVARKYLVEQGSIVATLKPRPSGEPVSAKGFGGTEQLTNAPSKPVMLPEWADVAVKSLAVPQPDLHPTDVTLPNGIRLIVQQQSVSSTVTVMGSIRHEEKMQTPPGKDGVADILDGLFPYGTKTYDRVAFQKELDDIAATESAGAEFSIKVLKQYFDRGVQLLADNELHPSLPEEAFKVVKSETGDFVAGNLTSPDYRVRRALDLTLLPKGDPVLRETTPQTIGAVTLEDVRSYYGQAFRPDLTTIVVIGDVTPAEARTAIEKYFGAWKATGTPPDVTLPAVPPNTPSAVNVPDPEQIQDSVSLAEELPMNRFQPDYYALQLGDHVLGGGFYATRLYHDVRQVAGYVYNIDDSLTATKTRTVYSVTYGCDPQNVSKARALVERDLIAMQTDNVSPAELQQAKALLLRQIPLGESSEDSIAAGLLARAQIDLPLDEPIRAARKYFIMSADDVRAAFAKWIRPKDFVQVVRGPAPQ
ncbi:MAG TPA: pitrilysin family protein [Bryobacteraceae bacterium]|nr:pitrilysin family protein [Bryobacteraceae bacterium]